MDSGVAGMGAGTAGEPGKGNPREQGQGWEG